MGDSLLRLHNITAYICAAAVIAGISCMLFAGSVRAADFSWVQATPEVVESVDIPYESRLCSHGNFFSASVWQVAGELSDENICMKSGEVLSVGSYSDESGIVAAVLFAGDSTAYPVNNLRCYVDSQCYYLPSRDIMFVQGKGEHEYRVMMYDNFTSRLKRSFDFSRGALAYDFNSENPEYTLTASDGYLKVKTMGVSPNDKWVAYEIVGVGLVRLNMETMEMKKFSNFRTSYWHAGPDIEYAISNSGVNIATAGLNMPGTVYEVDEDCGSVIRSNNSSDEIRDMILNMCSEQSFYSVSDTFIPQYRYARYPTFNHDSGELTFNAISYQGDYRKVTLRASGYIPPTKLEYLALGDSYSSGEGDVGIKADGTNYYLPFTDVGKDVCHISERSYPFLIGQLNNMNASFMKSVACSGARVLPDYIGPLASYSGQGKRFEDFSNSEREFAKLQALERDIPGRVPQVEFVKKYQPKVITLTAGGNDVGFSDIVNYCARGLLESVAVSYTCGFAQPGEMREMLAAAIDSQYEYSKMMIAALQKASPDTKIYLVGYPSLVKSESATCLNAGLINTAERTMINESISYLNQILASAAQKAGAVYVDVEDALVGGRLCEGSEYMTGALARAIDGGLDENIFHPNAVGHQRLAADITANPQFNFEVKDASLLPDETAVKPATPAYYEGYTAGDMRAYGKTIAFTPISADGATIVIDGVKVVADAVSDTFTAGGKVLLKLSRASFAPFNAVKVYAFSEKTSLGEYQSANDGSFEQEITLNLEPGVHTLVAEGLTYSGKPVKYYQIITVTSSNLQDADGDGIVNERDACMFMSEWYDEITGKDICASPATSEPEEKEKKDKLVRRKGLCLGHSKQQFALRTQPAYTSAVVKNTMKFSLQSSPFMAKSLTEDASTLVGCRYTAPGYQVSQRNIRDHALVSKK